MEGAKNAYRGFQKVRRADTPNQGLSDRQELRQPPAKPSCTEQVATQLVGGRRPSILQRWGAGVLPRRFPVALKALPEPWRLGRSEERGNKNLRGLRGQLTKRIFLYAKRQLSKPKLHHSCCCSYCCQVGVYFCLTSGCLGETRQNRVCFEFSGHS